MSSSNVVSNQEQEIEMANSKGQETPPTFKSDAAVESSPPHHSASSAAASSHTGNEVRKWVHFVSLNHWLQRGPWLGPILKILKRVET